MRVWNAITGEDLFPLLSDGMDTPPGGEINVRGVDWSPDGNFIASGSDDKIVTIWNAATGQLVLTYQQQSGIIWSLAWSPHGQIIVSGSDNKIVKVW